MKFNYNDGGRADTGFRGTTRDCVTRSIAIISGRPYREVYDGLNELARSMRSKHKSNSRTGVTRKVYEKYLLAQGFTWTPTMFIGQGCKVHLQADELPPGRLIVRLSKHLTAVIDGEIHDIFNPQRGGGSFIEWKDGVETRGTTPERCVYGYFIKP